MTDREKELLQRIEELQKQLKDQAEELKFYKGIYQHIMDAPHPEYGQ